MFDVLFSKVDDMGISAVQKMYEALATYLGPLFLSALTVYVVWWGYEMLFGRAQMTAGAFVWRFGRAFLCYSLIVSWATFSPLLVTPLVKAPDAVATIVCQAAGGSGCGDSNASMGQGLNDIWNAGMSGAQSIAAAGGYTGFMLYLLAGAVMVFVLVLCATAAVILMMGKMTMFILLGIGPIILCCALFNFTSSVVDGWMKSLAAYSLLPIVVYTILGLMTTLLKNTVVSIGSGVPNINTVAPFLFMCIATTLMLKEVVSVATAIAGGGPRIDDKGGPALAKASFLVGRLLLPERRPLPPSRPSATIGDGDPAAAQVRAASVNSRK